MTLVQFGELFTSTAQLGVLIWLVYSFYNGDIVSKKTLDKILESYQTQIKESMGEILHEISEIKKRGRW